MKLKILVGLLVFLIVVNLATIGTYVYYRVANHPEDDFRGLPPMLPPPMEALGQKERVELFKLMREFHEETRALRDSAHNLERESFNLYKESRVSKEKIDAKLLQIAMLRLEISKKAAARFIEAKAFLTPEQQDRFFGALMEPRPDMGQGGSPPGRGRPRMRGIDSMHEPPPPFPEHERPDNE